MGLGYVGCVSAACLANEGHRVIGVDVNPVKVNIINSGKSPIVEPGLEELIAKVVTEGKLKATTDFSTAIQQSDISLICVGTPSQKNGNVSLEYIFRVAKQIGQALKTREQYHVVVIRSTVPPGTLQKTLQIIAKQSGKRLGRDFGGASNPEFLREGSALQDFYHPPYTIVGEWDSKSGDYLEELYSFVHAPLIRTEVKIAELVKYANNVFHALKVAFANELGTICKAYGVDSHKLMNIFVQDTRLNLSAYYLKPGFAFGGSCLPKDVSALVYQAKKLDLELPLINSLIPSNREHIRRALDLILSYNKKRIGILGLSFKGNTDDLRESPMVEIVEHLIGKGYDLRIYDRNVHLARLFGANQEFINRKIPHISRLMVQHPKEVLDFAEMLVVGNNSSEFQDLIKKHSNHSIILDFVRIVQDTGIFNSNYEGLCW